MITIFIPNNNYNERKYILDVIFNEFLGVEYRIKQKQISNYEIYLSNGKKLIIIDGFFNKYKKKLEYLNINHIPKQIKFTSNDFLLGENIPIIYGNESIETSNNKICCFVDVFSSSFFMLTRWEEYVNKKRDTHGRFQFSESLAFKYDFLDRPIVNEYINLLKLLLLKIGFDGSFLNKKYQAIITHDIDHLYLWDTKKKFILHLLRDLIRKTSLKSFIKSIKYYINIRKYLVNDPYDTFDYLMNVSERNKVKSYFFFMAKGLSDRYDNQYESNCLAVKKNSKKNKKKRAFYRSSPQLSCI